MRFKVSSEQNDEKEAGRVLGHFFFCNGRCQAPVRRVAGSGAPLTLSSHIPAYALLDKDGKVASMSRTYQAFNSGSGTLIRSFNSFSHCQAALRD